MADVALSDPPVHWEPYLTVAWASDLNLLTEFPGLRPNVIWIRDVAGGTALVVRTRGVPTSDTSYTVTNEDMIPGQFEVIDSTTDVSELWVGYTDAP